MPRQTPGRRATMVAWNEASARANAINSFRGQEHPASGIDARGTSNAPSSRSAS